MNELAPRGHLRPLGGRENPRRARPESRSPRRCVHAWWRCLLFAGRSEGINQGTHDRHARASPLPQLHMRKGVNRNPSRRPGLAVSDSNLHAVKTGHSELAAFPGYASHDRLQGGQIPLSHRHLSWQSDSRLLVRRACRRLRNWLAGPASARGAARCDQTRRSAIVSWDVDLR